MEFSSHIIKSEDSWSIEICNLILNSFDRIDGSIISEDKSLIKIDVENSIVNLEIRLQSKNGDFCPIFLDVENNVVDIQLRNGAEFLYLYPISTEEELNRLEETLNNLLTYKISEKSFFFGERLVGNVYTTFYEKNDKLKEFKFGTGRFKFPFWKTPKIENKEYKSWIKRSSH